MTRANRNLGPVGLSVLLHVLIFGSMIVAVDYARPTPFTPLAVKATLVQEIPEQAPPPRVAEPEPEPEPVIEEPEPDNSEELRRQAEEEQQRLDALLEQQRLQELKKKQEEERERREREEAERKRRERDEAERKKREEEELERKRQEAERQRQEDIRRQREENERRRREEEAAVRQAELEAEERRFAARNSAEMAAYQFAIAQKIRRSWAVPASAGPETRCTVRVTQLPGGEVVGVSGLSCNVDDPAVLRSVEAAIRRSSPLPEPSDPDLFDRNLTLNLTLERDD